MKPPLSFLPALPAAVGVVAGILIHDNAGPGLAAAAAVASLAGFVALYACGRHYLSFYMLMTAVGTGLAYAHSFSSLPAAFAIPGSHLVKAEVIEADDNPDSPAAIVEFIAMDSVEVPPVRCRVSPISSAYRFVLHSVITLQCYISPVYGTADVPFDFDFSQSMHNDGISLKAYATSEIETVPPPVYHRIVNSARDAISNAIINAPVRGDTAGFLLAVILGDKQYLSIGDTMDYRSLGVAHVLALSGLHVGLLSSLFSLLIWPVRLLPRSRNLRALLLLAAIWAYTIVCGMGDSIVRAAIMLSTVTLASMLQRGYSPANALLLAITLILAGKPSCLYSPGFQLSVAAVAAIVLLSPIVPKKLKRHPIRYFLANMFVIPVAAMLGTALISAYHFSTFPSAFLVANIIVGLIFPYLLMGGALLAILSLSGLGCGIIGTLVDYAYTSLNVCIDLLARFSPHEVGGLSFSAWAFVPYAAAMAMLALAVYRRKLSLALVSTSLFVLSIIIVDVTRPTVPYSELYLVRYPSASIVMRSGHEVALLTTCHDNDIMATRELVNSRCRRFMQSRGCDSMQYIGRHTSGLPGYVLDGKWLAAAGRYIYILDDNDTISISSGRHAHYLLVSQKFAGDLREAVHALSPDSVILAGDIHPSRRRRFLREIDDHTRLIDLKTRPFSIIETK